MRTQAGRLEVNQMVTPKITHYITNFTKQRATDQRGLRRKVVLADV